MKSNLDNDLYGRTQVSLPAEFSAQAIAAWAAELPVANMDYSGDAILALLRALNVLGELASAERFGIVEQLRPIAYMLSQQGAERHLHDPAFPLTPSLKRRAARGLGISLELGRAYRRLVATEDFGGTLVLGEDSLALVIHRALEAYGRALLRIMEGYGSVPEGFWRDVYALYHLAESRQLHQFRVTDGGESDGGGGTIRDCFARIVLFARSCSHRHRPRKMWQIFELLGAFAAKAHLGVAPVLNGRCAPFCLDLDADVSPGYVNSPQAGRGGNQRFVFTDVLIQAMLKHFEDPANRRFNGGVLDKATLKRLLQALGPLERRKSPRISEDGECRLIVGFDPLMATLAGTTRQDERDQELAPVEWTIQYKGISWLKVPNYALEQPGPQESSARIADHRVQRSESSIGWVLHERKGGVSPQQIWAGTATGAPLASRDAIGLIGLLMNSSARGYCLLWTKKEVAKAKVGELVGLAIDGSSLHIGVIRWLRHNADEDLMFGVELISPNAQVVEVNLDGERVAGRKALFLAPNAALQQSAGLVLKPAFFQAGRILAARGPGGVRAYQLAKLLESTPSFQHFSLVEMDVPSQRHSSLDAY